MSLLSFSLTPEAHFIAYSVAGLHHFRMRGLSPGTIFGNIFNNVLAGNIPFMPLRAVEFSYRRYLEVAAFNDYGLAV